MRKRTPPVGQCPHRRRFFLVARPEKERPDETPGRERGDRKAKQECRQQILPGAEIPGPLLPNSFTQVEDQSGGGERHGANGQEGRDKDNQKSRPANHFRGLPPRSVSGPEGEPASTDPRNRP